MSDTRSFEDIISPLQSDTTYAYRACGIGNQGVVECGDWKYVHTGEGISPEGEQPTREQS